MPEILREPKTSVTNNNQTGFYFAKRIKVVPYIQRVVLQPSKVTSKVKIFIKRVAKKISEVLPKYCVAF